MNKTVPVTVVGIVLTALGTTTAVRPGQAPSAAPAAPVVQAVKQVKVVAEAGGRMLCTEAACDDPADLAGKVAHYEAATTLQARVCGFLAEYGMRDDVLAAAQAAGAKPIDTYCAGGEAAEKDAAGATSGVKADPAYRPKVMIAVLADPVHTELALRFDEAIDELQSTMQDLGWTYDQSWLPWDGKSREEDADFDKRRANATARAKYEDSPGVILFRGQINGEEPSQPLVVLIVGDTPTGGINAVQFGAAIKVWKKLTGWDNYFGGGSGGFGGGAGGFGGGAGGPADTKNPSDAATLSILGPTFSGSMPSLQAMLREVTAKAGAVKPIAGSMYYCPAKRFDVSVVSGTVSDSEALKEVEFPRGGSPQDGPTGGKPECGTLGVHPVSMAMNLTYEYERLEKFVRDHARLKGGDPNGEVVVARLSEAESSFGAVAVPIRPTGTVVDAAATREKRASKRRAAKDERQAAKAEKEEVLVKQVEPLHYYFPREISKLRAAYEQGGIFGFGGEKSSVRTQLHLSLSDTSREEDTVRTYSGDQEPATMEAAMSQLTGELERKKVNVAIVSATDVLDELFVTKYLAQHAPNVAVVVTDTDGLFTRGGDSSMTDAYVVGPWPLIAGNEEWATTKGYWQPPVRIHDSAGAQGLYAAGRWLVCEGAAVPLWRCNPVPNPDAKDTAHPYLQKTMLREYQPPVATKYLNDEAKERPPLWLSAVGRGGFWPIALVDADQKDTEGLSMAGDLNQPPLSADAVKGDLTGIQQPIPRSLPIVTALIALLLAWHAVACFRARLDRGFAWSYAFSDVRHQPQRLLLQIAVMLTVVPSLVLLKTPIWGGVEIRDGWYTSLNWTLQVLAVLLAVRPWLLLLAEDSRSADSKLRKRKNEWTELLEKYREAKLPQSEETDKTKEAAPGEASAGSGAKADKASGRPTYGLRRLLREGAILWRDEIWRTLLWLALMGGYLWLCNGLLWWAIAPPASAWPTERAFFFYRSGHLFSGSSPALPLLLLGAALTAYMVNLFERMVFYGARIPRLPEKKGSHCPSSKDVSRLNDLLSRLMNPWRLGLFGAVVVVMALFVVSEPEVIPRSLAHGRFDAVVIALSGVVTVLLLHDLATAVMAWILLKQDCLMPLSRSPLRWGFTWIKGWSWRRIWAPGAISPDRVLDYLRRMSEANHRALADEALENEYAASQQNFMSEPRDGMWANSVAVHLGKLHDALAKSAEDKLGELMAMWQRDHGPITGSDAELRGLHKEIPLEKLEPPKGPLGPADDWTQSLDRVAKEEFVALLYLGYIRMVLLQVRNRIMTATGMYVLLLWALTSYPFLNHHLVVMALTCLLGVLSAGIIWTYAGMHRDDILSRTTQTTSGKLDAAFFTKVLGMVGLPLLTLVASQFPEVSSVVFSWLEPGLSTMK
jgi:hypothetical protein